MLDEVVSEVALSQDLQLDNMEDKAQLTQAIQNQFVTKANQYIASQAVGSATFPAQAHKFDRVNWLLSFIEMQDGKLVVKAL